MTILEHGTGLAHPASEMHPAPAAATRCDLWLTLRTRHSGGSGARIGLTHDQPSIYLHLRSSNLLLALPDEDPDILDDDAAVAIKIDVTDALGLGLAPSDFESGVGLCGGPGVGAIDGWRCRDASVIGVGDDGREFEVFGPDGFRDWLAEQPDQ